MANFVLHELRCRNYCTYCELCDEAVPNETLSEHQRDVHTHKPCPLCGQSVLPHELEAHKVRGVSQLSEQICNVF